MSHRATHWAFSQRGLKPSARVVLLYLADRHNPDHGCFPSLETLADDCEMSRRSIQDQLAELQRMGLIKIEKMPRNAGRLPVNRYRLACEADFDQHGETAEPAKMKVEETPLAKSAQGKKKPSPWAKSRKNLGQNLPPNPVREPVKETRAVPAAVICGMVEVDQDNKGQVEAWGAWLESQGLPTVDLIPELRRKAARGGFMLPSRYPPTDGLGRTRALRYLITVAPSVADLAEKRLEG